MPTVRQRVEAIEKECSGVWGQSGITQWERDRLDEWKGKANLSEKQEAVLKTIEGKAFGSDDDG